MALKLQLPSLASGHRAVGWLEIHQPTQMQLARSRRANTAEPETARGVGQGVLKTRVSAEELLLGAEVLLHGLNRLPVAAPRQHLAEQPAVLERELLWQA